MQPIGFTIYQLQKLLARRERKLVAKWSKNMVKFMATKLGGRLHWMRMTKKEVVNMRNNRLSKPWKKKYRGVMKELMVGFTDRHLKSTFTSAYTRN